MSTFGKIGARPLLLKNTPEYAEEQMYKELFEKTVTRTFDQNTDLNFINTSIIGVYAMSYCTFHNVSLPNVIEVKRNAFQTSKFYGDKILFPNLTTSGNNSFSDVQVEGNTPVTVTEISMPKLVTVADNMFYQSFQRSNESRRPVILNFDSATSIIGSAFYNCGGIRRIYAPKVTSISNNYAVFLNLGRQYCGETRATPADECQIILGSRELDTGMTMSGLMSLSQFPFGAVKNQYSPTFYCRNGKITYDTTTSTWVQNPYT